jgi:hypothetical protein
MRQQAFMLFSFKLVDVAFNCFVPTRNMPLPRALGWTDVPIACPASGLVLLILSMVMVRQAAPKWAASGLWRVDNTMESGVIH